MKSRFPSLAILIALFALTASAAWAGNAKVKVCHVPPGNPGNFHTITVSENALQAHLGHGDLAGACSAHCDSLCSDGDPCTIDACDSSERCLLNHPPVNCNDGNLCTVDTCSAAAGGCQSTPIACADGNNCTVDACDPVTGSCVFPAVECPPGQSCNPSQTNPVCEATLTCICNEALPGFLDSVSMTITDCEGGGSSFSVAVTTPDGRQPFAERFATFGACGFSFGGFLDITAEQGQACFDFLLARAAAEGVTCH